ncbi:MAG TPA: RNA polymerase sigma factor [Gemmatimonadaceae bacterium]|nr:RNA polymerase sigma factor [Gemmatimonadaceae bacterium]
MTRPDVPGFNLATMTDAILVRRVLDGDTAAFTMLVDRHAAACTRFATRMLGNREDAEDATQETFLRAYRSLARYEERQTFRTWLFQILINRCRTAAVRRQRRHRMFLVDDTAIAAASVRPAVDAGDLRAELKRAIDALDPDQREAFLLKHVEQLSYDEMAAATGVGVSALKMRVKRACDRMQWMLRQGEASDVGT